MAEGIHDKNHGPEEPGEANVSRPVLEGGGGWQQPSPTHQLAARQRVRKRDVSFGARSPAGLQTWDVLQTIIATAKLLGVNVWHYLHDRVSGTYALPALADLIRQRTTWPTQLPDALPALAA
jgi:hypothetical protein